MNQPTYLLPNGARIRTHAELGSTRGMMIVDKHLAARAPNSVGTIVGVVGGHGGDVYWVEHSIGGDAAAYCFTEFELEPRVDPISELEAWIDALPPGRHVSIKRGAMPGDVHVFLYDDREGEHGGFGTGRGVIQAVREALRSGRVQVSTAEEPPL